MLGLRKSITRPRGIIPASAPSWIFHDPLGDCSYTASGGSLSISLPSGTLHDLNDSAKNAPALIQTVADEDFVAIARFTGSADTEYQDQGLVAYNSARNACVRFDAYYVSGGYNLYARYLQQGGSSGAAWTNSAYAGTEPIWLRMSRSVDSWDFEVSSDGVTWSNVTSGLAAFVVDSVGVYGANNGSAGYPAWTMGADNFSLS